MGRPEAAGVPATTVLIADDHPFYRAGLATMLRESGFEVVGEVANGEAAIRAASELAPDLVVMDLKMPGISGLEATRRLIAEVPSTRVLVLTVSSEEDDVADAILAGAGGYVLKDGPAEEIAAAIRGAAVGQTVITPGFPPTLLDRMREAASRPLT
jgi:DNA-binding NarL/FixJ family response regulator